MDDIALGGAIRELFEKYRAEYLAEARQFMKDFARDGRIVTINDLNKYGPAVPDGMDPRVRGAVFAGGDWERLGYGPSDRSTSHGRPIQRFRLKAAA